MMLANVKFVKQYIHENSSVLEINTSFKTRIPHVLPVGTLYTTGEYVL